MKPVTASLIYIYSKLLHLYPVNFHAEFSDEMQVVFGDLINEAARDGILPMMVLSLRELGGLPFNILREIWHEFKGKELIMIHENSSNSPATTGQVMMGALPFFMFGLIMIMLELPVYLFDEDWFNSVGGFLLFVFLILPAIGFGIGWVQNFPRWSYPYTGIALILAFYIQNASTPGVRIFGIPIFGRELWGWRSWIPLAVAFVIALVVSRSFKPFIRFFTNLWNDWTIPSYLMAGILPMLVLVAFDEIDRIYTLYFMIPFGVLLVGMAVFYLQGRNAWHRVLALTAGVIAIIFPAVIGTISYWLPRNGIYPSGVRTMWTRAITITIIMLIPAWLELARRFVGRLRTA